MLTTSHRPLPRWQATIILPNTSCFNSPLFVPTVNQLSNSLPAQNTPTQPRCQCLSPALHNILETLIPAQLTTPDNKSIVQRHSADVCIRNNIILFHTPYCCGLCRPECRQHSSLAKYWSGILPLPRHSYLCGLSLQQIEVTINEI